jgi:CRP-like cAMP-binding protein
VLAIVTFRPEFVPAWSGQRQVSSLALARLGRRDGAALVDGVVGAKPLPAEMTTQIVEKTDGVPLFVEELTRTVLESGLLKDAGARWELSEPLPPLAIPSTLHDSLLARLDRLAPGKEIAQIGAAIGREFSHPLLAAVADWREAELRAALDQLVASELVFRRGSPPEATYSFKHALVQDTAYGTLLKSRRQYLHARIMKVLEQRFADVVENQPELLSGLPPSDLEDLLRRVERCGLDRRQILVEANEPIRYVHFPLSGVVSLVMATVNGATVEVAMVGNEGMIGLPVLFGSETTPISAVVQVSGEALRMSAPAFKEEVRNCGALVQHLHLHAQAVFVQIAQSTACTRHHSVSQRCARWLLTAYDRVGDGEFAITQEALAQMLGVRRASVSASAAKLQEAGLIRYRRGNVTLVDREALEQASCECYRIVKAEYDRLLGDARL